MSSLYLHSRSQRLAQSKAGFGLIELLVSISIMVAVSAVVFVKQRSFNSAVLLRSQTYQVALAAREVQLNAVSISGITGDFRSLQGLYFDTANNGVYKIYKDADNDGRYDSTEEFGKQGTLNADFYVRGMRVNLNTGAVAIHDRLSIAFMRPNFDARFYGDTTQLDAGSVEVDIARRDRTGDTPDVVRTLIITSTGQITVKPVP
ncbi:MAG: hypothetical protein RLZZ480_798 [Candidatus Parcubacteria bacterium]|jgi:prepilin-type N-terminal cleavage/methylation domain-containing protein